MEIQQETDARLLRRIESYLSELLRNAKSPDDLKLVAEALVVVQGALTTMERGTTYAA